MNEPSAFQFQYPLSPRKFCKKLLGKSIQNLTYSIVLSFIPIFFLMNPLWESNNGISGLIFATLWVFFGIFIILTIITSIYYKVYIKRYYYDCEEQFITIKKKVFGPTEIHVQYQKIQDVYVDQDIMDRILGLYDVHIASATVTSGIEAHIDGVNASVAENLKNIILAKIHGATNAPINTYQTPTPQSPQPQSNPVQFSQRISSETYPISEKWIWSAIASAIIGGLFFMFIPGIFFSKIFNSNIVIFVMFLAGFLLSIVGSLIWKNNFYFEFLPDYILLRTGLISRSENHLPYKSIQNVLNSQGLIDRMLGLSTVTIQNAAQQMAGGALQGSGISLLWQPKEKAEELNNILNDIVSKINPQNSSNMMGL